MSRKVSWIPPLLTLAVASPAWARSSRIEALSTPIEMVVQTLGGSVLAGLLTLALLVCGISIAFAQHHGYDRIGNLIIGGSLAIAAPVIVALWFAATGAAYAVVMPVPVSTLALLIEDIATIGYQGWISYLAWRGARYVYGLARGL